MMSDTSPQPISEPTVVAIHEEFTLTDAVGNPHDYILTLHPATAGQAVMFQLMALAAEPLGRMLETLVGVEDFMTAIDSNLSDAVAGVGDMDLGELLTSIDWAVLGNDIRKVLGDPKCTAIVKELFRHTLRDAQPMSETMPFDIAYRGNYLEMLNVMWRIIKFNGFFPLTGMF